VPVQLGHRTSARAFGAVASQERPLISSHPLSPQSRRWQWAIAGLAVLALAGCGFWQSPVSIPATLRTPTLVGVVERVETRVGPPLIHLVGDGTYDITGSTDLTGAGDPKQGTLFLAGTSPSSWYGYVNEDRPGCFGLDTRGRDEGATIATEVGLRLTKAPGFTAPGDTDGIYETPNNSFCLNDKGQVTSYD